MVSVGALGLSEWNRLRRTPETFVATSLYREGIFACPILEKREKNWNSLARAHLADNPMQPRAHGGRARVVNLL